MNPFKKRIGLRVALLVFAALGSIYLLFSPNAVPPFYIHLTIFVLGPGLVVFDMFTPPSDFWLTHTFETATRLLVLIFLYFLLPSGIMNTVVYMANFVLMYAAVVLGFQKFAIKPDHWLRYDHLFHTGFITAMVLAIVLEVSLYSHFKGAGLLFLTSLVIGLAAIWRYALWNNALQELSSAQHAYVWPNLANRLEPDIFWKKLYNYSLEYPTAMPHSALCVLSIPMLLSFFKMSPHGVRDDEYNAFRENIKSMVNTKEPRAIIVWQLYSPREAAAYIERIDEFVESVQKEILDLPTL